MATQAERQALLAVRAATLGTSAPPLEDMATQVELDAAVASVLGYSALSGRRFRNTPPAMRSTAVPGLPTTAEVFQNLSGRPVMIQQSVGVISEPGQNGHIEARVASARTQAAFFPANAADVIQGEHACRNNASGVEDTGEEVGSGGQLTFIVPPSWWWGFFTTTIAGWTTPSFAYVHDSWIHIL